MIEFLDGLPDRTIMPVSLGWEVNVRGKDGVFEHNEPDHFLGSPPPPDFPGAVRLRILPAVTSQDRKSVV